VLEYSQQSGNISANVLEYSQQRVGTFLDDRGENIRESSVGQIILLAGSGNGVSIRESPLFFIDHTELEFLNNLWGLGTELE
jgi:hypothetical protein